MCAVLWSTQLMIVIKMLLSVRSHLEGKTTPLAIRLKALSLDTWTARLNWCTAEEKHAIEAQCGVLCFSLCVQNKKLLTQHSPSMSMRLIVGTTSSGPPGEWLSVSDRTMMIHSVVLVVLTEVTSQGV